MWHKAPKSPLCELSDSFLYGSARWIGNDLIVPVARYYREGWVRGVSFLVLKNVTRIMINDVPFVGTPQFSCTGSLYGVSFDEETGRVTFLLDRSSWSPPVEPEYENWVIECAAYSILRPNGGREFARLGWQIPTATHRLQDESGIDFFDACSVRTSVCDSVLLWEFSDIEYLGNPVLGFLALVDFQLQLADDAPMDKITSGVYSVDQFIWNGADQESRLTWKRFASPRHSKIEFEIVFTASDARFICLNLAREEDLKSAIDTCEPSSAEE